MIRRGVGVLCGVLLFVSWLPSSSATPAVRPNFLIVNTDDQSFDTMMAMPSTKALMADAGTTYTHAYTGSPMCCPSRATLMSGRYPHNNGVRTFKIEHFQHNRTMQHDFHFAGYRTAIVGKMFVEWRNSKRPPFFSDWTLGWGYRHATYFVNGKREVVRYGPTFVFGQAAKYLRVWNKRDPNKPWLMYVTPRAPHRPFTAETRFSRKRFRWNGTPATHERDRSDKPPWVRQFHVTTRRGAHTRVMQLRTLRSVDVGFTRLMATLKKLGELDNTYVIFTSDSGFMWGEHGLTEKHFPYEGADHVPFFFRGPGIPAGTVDDRLTVNADVAPTLYGLAGITPSYTVDGRSFLGPPAHSQILIEYTRAANPPYPPSWASLVSLTSWFTQYRAHRRVVFNENYDLTTDPYQLDNTLKGRQQPPPALVSALDAARNCVGASCP